MCTIDLLLDFFATSVIATEKTSDCGVATSDAKACKTATKANKEDDSADCLHDLLLLFWRELIPTVDCVAQVVLEVSTSTFVLPVVGVLI